MADHRTSSAATGTSTLPFYGPPVQVTSRLRARYGDFIVAAAKEIHASISVRGVQGTTDLIDRVVDLADGNESRLRALLKPALDHGHIIDLRGKLGDRPT